MTLNKNVSRVIFKLEQTIIHHFRGEHKAVDVELPVQSPANYYF